MTAGRIKQIVAAGPARLRSFNHRLAARLRASGGRRPAQSRRPDSAAGGPRRVFVHGDFSQK